MLVCLRACTVKRVSAHTKGDIVKIDTEHVYQYA